MKTLGPYIVAEDSSKDRAKKELDLVRHGRYWKKKGSEGDEDAPLYKWVGKRFVKQEAGKTETKDIDTFTEFE